MTTTAFQRWYQKNREEFNQRRAELRKTDPQYAARQRAYRPPAEPDPKDCLTLAQVAEALGVSLNVVRGWATRGIIPGPIRQKGTLWIHAKNLGLLNEFNLKFMSKYARRVPDADRSVLEDWSNWLNANWHKPEN